MQCDILKVVDGLLPGALDLLDLLVLALLPEGDAARDGGVAPVRAHRGGGLPGVVTDIKRNVLTLI